MSNLQKTPVIRVQNIHKNFGSIHVLRGVNLEVYPGEAVALVGDNGSGKSTLIKILSGTYKPAQGSIYIHNKLIERLTPKKALSEGIATVYQDLSLDNYRDVTGNIFLGQELTKWGLVLDYPAMEQEAIRLLKELNINIPDPSVPVGYLSGGQRQGVAIARAVFQGKEIMIFDEPTAAMGVKETATTLKLIHSLTKRGIAVIIVSHNLFQVFDIAHRVCIIKRGTIVKDILTEDSSPQEVHRSLIAQTELEDRMEQSNES
jgi:ABC-type sugar transport system ATPase subunit